MRTDGNPRLTEVRPGFEVPPAPWPRALSLAVLFFLSGIGWALILGFLLILGALIHG